VAMSEFPAAPPRGPVAPNSESAPEEVAGKRLAPARLYPNGGGVVGSWHGSRADSMTRRPR
jgi:hypothetical protein